ncbi:TetR/AcrR family transcriptional regulator [Microbacterium azadirachtae]|uniref:Fatty acid metabolism regulator protein n=1 Tax=Microbacterium azadirachtae TaxID=582680 RepID=A0A0F0LI20_9MICO|nr:TetR/AcrR family transcriptional regulator [Microbacterium azadirachtae]KJL31950.1 Fatty acid metabolism regulator protein [Microbacterium azadirachtae]
MTTPARGVGRPRVSSRETIAEAACELFLESGYEGTSIAGIAQRAGVSRSSFFNYFSSKSDVLWSGFDERLDRAVAALEAPGAGADSAGIEAVLAAILEGVEPDPLALAFGNAQAMGLAEELQRESALRQGRLATALSEAARGAGVERIRADVLGAAYAIVVLSSLRVWAEGGAGHGSPLAQLQHALPRIADLHWG